MKHINEELSHKEVRNFHGIVKEEKVINKVIHKVYITNDELSLMINEKLTNMYPEYPKAFGIVKVDFLEDFAGKTMAKISWQEHK